MNKNHIDKLISEIAKKLPRHDPPDQLWDMIETRLEMVKTHRPFWQRIIDFFVGLSFPNWQSVLKYSVIATAAAFIFLMFWLLFKGSKLTDIKESS